MVKQMLPAEKKVMGVIEGTVRAPQKVSVQAAEAMNHFSC
jgi:hypothetical protein